MILKLENNETRWERNWNDTAANKMTRNGNTVTVETITVYAPTQKKTMTYQEFKAWRLDIHNTKNDINS